MSNKELEVENLRYCAPVGKSDHSVLIFDFLIEGTIPVEEETTTKINYFKGNYNDMRKELENIDWESLFEGKEVCEMWEIFLRIYKELVDKYVPKTQFSSNKNKFNPKWLTKHAKNKIDQKERAWERYRKRKTRVRYEYYKTVRNLATDAVRNAKASFEKDIAKNIKKNKRAFYAYVRSKTTIKEGVSKVKGTDGTLSTTNQESSTTLNVAFQSVFTIEPPGPIPEATRHYEGVDLQEIYFDVNDVKKDIANLKEQSAPGGEGVHPKVLKECDSLAVPLCMIFKKSFEGGILPRDWKDAVVTPIFKKGSKTDPLNYRPVSLTAVPCKLLEKIITRKIKEHLEENNILSQEQHGFRSKRSCLTQLLEYFLELENEYDSRNKIDAIYLDCKKAFDSVPHERLKQKLKAAGIGGRLLQWISSFLEDRRQRVSVKGALSDWLPVYSGVPQGSVIGPVLFLIYINDLLDETDSKGKLFADDAKNFRAIKNEQDIETLQQDLMKLQEWSQKWLLKFNESKCKVMHIGGYDSDYQYFMNDVALERTTEEKDLGVYVTPDLKTSVHVAKVAAKANSVVGQIKKTFTYMDKEMFLELYLHLVRPLMEYAVQVWSPKLLKDVNKLEKVQRRATKLVPEISDLPYETRLQILGLPSLKERRIRGDMIEVFKILNGFENIDSEKFFKRATVQDDDEPYEGPITTGET